MTKFFSEIRRRRVLQTFIPYIGFVWLALQVVSVATQMLQLSPMIDTLCAVTLFAGMPIMLYLSWFFDFTASGLKRTVDADTGEIPAFGPAHWVFFAVIAVVSAYLGSSYFLDVRNSFEKERDGVTNQAMASSVVVVPFADASAEQSQTYLASGLAEEISRLLGANTSLKVAASSSARSLSEQGLDPVSVARRLEMDMALTGSVRKQGSKLRVFSELIDVASGKVVWSSTYNRDFTDVFSIESEIARSTANSLIDDYIGAGQLQNPLSTKSADAYVLYLKGRQAYNLQTSDSIRQAREYFEQALALDPEYSQAYVSLADTVSLLADGSRNFGVLKPEIAKMLANEHLAKALIRNPELAEAHAVQGRVFDLGGEPLKALSALNKAIALNPSLAKAHMWKYLLLRDLGREVEAFETLQLARALDPESITLEYNYGIELDRRGSFDEAMLVFDGLISDYPESPMGYAGTAGTAYSLGDLSRSVDYWQQAYERSPANDDYLQSLIGILLTLGLNEAVRDLSDNPAYEPIMMFSEGRHEELAEEMRILSASYPDDPWIAFEAAWHFMLLNEQQEAFDLLAKVDELMAPGDKLSMPYCSPGIEIAWAYGEQQLSSEAEPIILACQKSLNALDASGIKRHEQAYLQIRINALRGVEPAADALLTLVRNGYSESWIAEDPLLADLQNSPAYQQAIKLLKSNLERERRETRSVLSEPPSE